MESKVRLNRELSGIILMIYGLVGVLNVCAHFLEISWLVFPSKLLLMPLLATYLVFSRTYFPEGNWRLLLLALLGSWAGDILLELAGGSVTLFLGGMAAFLMAHVFYIVYFTRMKKWSTGQLKEQPLIITIFILYLIALLIFLAPHLQGILKPAVFIYGVFITIMALSAFNTLRGTSGNWKRMYVLGTILFVVSDSMIALRNFYPEQVIPKASAWIMLTYILAQAGIITGIINSTKWEK